MIIGTEFKFSAAHRQREDPGKYKFLHGHDFYGKIRIEAKINQDIGYILDFKIIKQIADNFDHKVIFHENDINECKY